MRVLPALLCALVLAGCGSSNDGTRDMDTGTGGIVSDAICSQMGGGGKPAPRPKSGAPASGSGCNELLRAAGRC